MILASTGLICVSHNAQKTRFGKTKSPVLGPQRLKQPRDGEPPVPHDQSAKPRAKEQALGVTRLPKRAMFQNDLDSPNPPSCKRDIHGKLKKMEVKK